MRWWATREIADKGGRRAMKRHWKALKVLGTAVVVMSVYLGVIPQWGAAARGSRVRECDLVRQRHERDRYRWRQQTVA